MAKIFNGAGEWSTLTADSAGKTIAGAQVVGTGNDLQMKIDYNDQRPPGAYPIVLVTYEIVCDKGNPAGSAAAAQVVPRATRRAPTASRSLTTLGYAPLPESVRTKVAAAVALS